MKLVLVFSFTLVTIFSFTQKKLIAYESRYFDENTNIYIHDSISWLYNTWKGSINNFEPKFDLFDFNYEFIPFAKFIPYDSYLFYSFTNNSPSLQGSNIQTFTNGLLSEHLELVGTNFKHAFQYDGNGNQVLKNSFISDGSSGWTQTGAMSQDFDQFGNILVRTYYQNDTTGPKLSADSMTYVPGTFLLSSQTSYQYNLNTNTASPYRKNEMTYQNSEIQEIDYYFSNGLGELYYKFKYNYTYSGNTLSNYKRFDIVNGIPDSTTYLETTFQYNGMNQLTQREKSNSSDTNVFTTTFEYDSDGFLIKKSFFGGFPNTPNNQLWIERRYTFANTANIDELNEAEVSIFPNPTSDVLNIESEGKVETVSIFNSVGQLLLQQNGSKIDVRHLPTGDYVLKGQTDKGVFTEKFIKK